MKTKIALVNIHSAFRNKYVELELPLSLMYLSARLKKLNYKVEIHDIENSNIDRLVKYLANEPLFFIGITSTFGVWAPDALDFAKKIKSVKKNVPIIVGGINVSAATDCYTKETCFDYFAIGEGENTIGEFAVALENNCGYEKIDGLIFRRGKKLAINRERGFEKEIDNFEIDFECLDINKYIRRHPDKKVLLSYQCSRGCPFNCAFCYNSSFNKRRWRKHSLSYILGHMKYLKSRFNFNYIRMIDDHFFANKDWAYNVMDALHEINISLTLLDARAPDLDHKFFDKLSANGVASIYFGTESENARVLKYIRKQITREDIEKAVQVASEYPDIKVSTQFILGLPTHTVKEVEDSIKYHLDLMDKCSNFCCSLVVYSPLPGSDLFKEAIKHGFKNYSCIDDFRRLGIRFGRPFEYERNWLSWKKAEIDALKNISRVSDLYLASRAGIYAGNFISRPIYALLNKICRWRLIHLKTRYFYEDRILSILRILYRWIKPIGKKLL